MSDTLADYTAHAKLSPSSASGWMQCAAYPDVQAQYLNEDNEAAAEGTAAHAISDFCLTYGFDAYDMIGTVTNITGRRYKRVKDSSGKLIKTDEVEHVTWSFTWTEEDAELLQPGIDRIRELDGEFFGETRVDLSEWLGDGQFGTMDRFILGKDFAEGNDLKWGRGIPVQAVNSKQVRLYLLGAMKKHAPHITDPNFPIYVSIDQPRNAAGGGIWKITLGELREFGEEARVAAEATRQPNPPRNPSADACLWCAGRDECDAYHKFNLSFLGMDDFSDLDDLDELELPNPETFTPARRRVIMEHAPLIKKWLESIHASLFQAVMNGGDAAGLKLVEGRKNPDKWKDAKAAEKALAARLGDKAFTKKLITPTQAGKAISLEDWKPIYEQHVVVGQRKPTLVDEADDRPAIESFTDTSDFEDLD